MESSQTFNVWPLRIKTMKNMTWIWQELKFEVFIFSFRLEGTPAFLILLSLKTNTKQPPNSLISSFEAENSVIQWLSDLSI